MAGMESSSTAIAEAVAANTPGSRGPGSVHSADPSALGDSDDDFEYEEVKVER